MAVVDHDPPGGQSGCNATPGFVMGDRHVEMYVVPLRTGRVHLLEPDRRSLPHGIDQRVFQTDATWLIDIGVAVTEPPVRKPPSLNAAVIARATSTSRVVTAARSRSISVASTRS